MAVFPTAPYRRTRFATVVLTTLVTLTTACGTDGSGSRDGSSKAGADAAGYPRTLENCGEKVTVEQPPQRAVSLNQGTTEIMLSLGLADRMQGTATWTDPVMKGLGKENAKVQRLADNNPSFERVLAEEPDFVASSFEATLGKGGVATRKAFRDLGVPGYLSPTDCSKNNSGNGDGARGKPLTMNDVYDEVRDLAKVFGVEKRGEKLVAELKDRKERATKGVDASGTDLVYWFANSESPYLGGCCGAPGIITRAVGAGNAFDDTHDEWPRISWEKVADRDPDVIVLGDLTRESETAESAAAKIKWLESNPVTREMKAVEKKRYVLLSGAAMNPSIRTVEGIEKVAKGLRSYGLAG